MSTRFSLFFVGRIDLGSYPLTGGMYIWFAPMRNPAIEKIYIDRIVLVREEQ